MRQVAVIVFALTALAGHVPQGSSTSAGGQTSRAADLAAIERLRQQDIAATVSRDPVALTDLWTDDAIRLGAGAPAEVGKKAIRESNERQTANKGFKVVSYVPETKDFTFLDGGWAVEWRTFTASYLDSPGGEAKQNRGTVLGVFKKLPDGSWKVFRRWGHGAGCHRQSRWPVACSLPASRSLGGAYRPEVGAAGGRHAANGV